jgi:PIN domain nuclease of toxin-antitoxin system
VTVLDTHAWLWWISGDARLSRTARRVIESDGEPAIATISVWETATLARLGRLRLAPDLRTWLARALGGSGVTALALTSDVAAAAGVLPDAFPGDPADRIAYATAVSAGAQLVTKDRRLRTYDPARTVW